MNKFLKIFLGLVFAGAATGCLNIKLENQFSDPDAITTVDTARELLASAYNSLPRYQLELAVLSDDFYPTNWAQQYAEMLNLYNWQDNAIENLSSQIWGDYYMTVAYLNTLLTRLGGVVCEDEEDVAELACVQAEAQALKAWCFFDLLRFYGPAYSEAVLDRDGIILKNRLELDFLPRASVRECVATIDGLLTAAEGVLSGGGSGGSTGSGSGGVSGSGSGSVSSGATAVYYIGASAVAALRTEFELWRGDYKAAVAAGLPLLTDLETRLSETEYDNLWSDNASAERIFAPYIFNSFYIDLNYDRERGDYFRLADEVTYDDSDVRKSWCEYQGPAAGVRSLGKYNRLYYENTEVRYINTLRYSGVCFAVAEAYARDGSEPEAIALMNRYLGVRGASVLSDGLRGEDLVSAILMEKQKEFVGEGTRYFDMKRCGVAAVRRNAAGAVSATVRADDYRWLLPIPASEYRYNDRIGAENQNPGWSYEAIE